VRDARERLANRDRQLATIEARFANALGAMVTYLIDAGYGGFNLVRHANRFVAVAQTLGAIDLPRLSADAIDGFRRECLWLEDDTLPGLKRQVDALGYRSTPELLDEGYRGFNLLAFGCRYYAVAQSLGAFDFVDAHARRLPDLIARNRCRVAATVEELRAAVDALAYWPGPELLEEGYRGFNLVGYEDHVHGVATRLGVLDLTRMQPNTIRDHAEAGAWVVADSLLAAKRAIDTLLSRPRTAVGANA
jgi:hypothetical protein